MDTLYTQCEESDHINNSDSLSSNLSSLSGLTGFEEELYDIKCLINSKTSNSKRFTHTSSNNEQGHLDVLMNEQRIRNLTIELQNALKLNEKYKNDLYNLERKIELANHEKFERLFRQNAQLETQLDLANNQVQNLSKNLILKTKVNENSNSSKLHSKLLELENQNYDLRSQLNLSQNETKHWKRETETNENLNVKLRVELEEMKIDLIAKVNSVNGLKSKIVEQHLEMQNNFQNMVKLNNSVKLTENELECNKKSVLWYKDQFHASQSEKNTMSQKMLDLQASLATKQHDWEVLSTELNKWRNKFTEEDLRAKKEKGSLLRQIDNLKSEINTKSHLVHVRKVKLSDETDRISKCYEQSVEDLTQELLSIKGIVSEQQSSFNDVSKQNAELLSKNTVLQKSLNEKQILIETLLSVKNDLNLKLNLATTMVETKEALLLEISNEKADLEVALNAAHQEKLDVQDITATLRDDFNKFHNNYNQLKEELHSKNKQILSLQKEKQELFMNNNWKVCEIENSSAKLKTVENQIFELNKHEQDLLKEKDALIENNTTLFERLESLQEINTKLKATVQEQVEKIQYLTNISDLQVCTNNETVLRLNNSLTEIKKKVEIENENKTKLQNVAIVLTKDVTTRDELIQKFTTKIVTLEESLDNYKHQLHKIELTNSLFQAENMKLKEEIAKFVVNNFTTIKMTSTISSDNSVNHNKDKKIAIIESQCLESYVPEMLNNIYRYLRDFESSTSSQEYFSNVMTDYSKLCGKNIIEETLINICKSILVIHNTKTENVIGINELKRKICFLKTKLLLRIKNLENKCSLLNNNYKKCETTIQAFIREYNVLINNSYGNSRESENPTNESSDCKIINKIESKCAVSCEDNSCQTIEVDDEESIKEIMHLKTLLKVAELKQKENQKRFDRNNHTLLKKIKEHMKGRNAAEKQCTYLRELYDTAFEELNHLKLIVSGKDYELESLRKTCEKFQMVNEKMKQNIINLETKVADKECVLLNYAEMELLRNSVTDLENKIKSLESKKMLCENELQNRDSLLIAFKAQIQDLVLGSTTLQKNNNSLQLRFETLSRELNEKQALLDELTTNLEIVNGQMKEAHKQLATNQQELSLNVTGLQNVKQLLSFTEEKNGIYLLQIEDLSSKIEQVKGEVDHLHAQKQTSESYWSQKENDLRGIITSLQSELQTLHNHLRSIRRDKYFLQRLCTDLKFALHSATKQNKVFKSQLESVVEDRNECTSLPDLMCTIPSPEKYDDQYINQLLQQTNSPFPPKPLSDLENSLNILKQEMNSLRKQITEKAQIGIES